jgi:spermidine synthase
VGLINKVITTKGVVSMVASNMFSDQEAFESELKAFGEIFKIVMPARYEDADLKMQNILIASNKYHPTADINLQRADLTEGYEYYNSDIAIGAFTLPTTIRKRFLGDLKL